MARWNAHEFLTFELNHGLTEFLCHRKCRVDLPREARLPKCFKNGSRKLPSHHRDCISQCHKPGAGKALLNRADAKEMISMAMRRIDGGQILSTCADPFGERPVLLHRDEGVDQHGISFTRDQR